MSEESELKSEVASLFALKMPSVIPPFGAKLRMSGMVLWEFIRIAWKSSAKCVLITLAIGEGNETC